MSVRLTSRSPYRVFAAVLLLAVLASLMPAPASAAAGAAYYVDPIAGIDAPGRGTLADPVRTIQFAAGTLAVAGDRVVCLPGTYSQAAGEPMPVLLPSGVTLGAQTPGTAVLDGGGSTGCLEVHDAGAGTAVSGLVIRNGSAARGGGIAVSGAGPALVATGWPLIEGNRIEACTAATGAAISVSGVVDTRIVDNEIVSNGDGSTLAGGGIAAEGRGATGRVEGNTIRANTSGAGAGVALIGSGPWTVYHNTITGNMSGGAGGSAYECDDASGTIIERNMISENLGGTAAGVISAPGRVISSTNVYVANETSVTGSAGALMVTDTDVWCISDTYYDNRSAGANGFDGIVVKNRRLYINDSILWHSLDVSATAAQDLRCEGIGGSAMVSYSITRIPSMEYPLAGWMRGHDDPLLAVKGPRGWDMRPRRGSPAIDRGFPDLYLTTLDFWGRIRPLDGDVNGVAMFDRGACEVSARAQRLAEADRYAQSAVRALNAHPGLAGVHDVVLVCGEDRAAADAIAAGGLCWAYDAPLLLTRTSALPPSTRRVFEQLAARGSSIALRVHVAGGTGSIPQARLDEIASVVGTSNVVFDRILASGTRYDLAAAIAQRMHDVRPSEAGTVALVANGADSTKLYDAVALYPIARAQGHPILLVSRTGIPAATAAALSTLGLTDRYVAGGSATVAESVRSALGAKRWAGADRYSTAVAVAKGASAKRWVSFSTIAVAGGTKGLWDAVAGGAFVGRQGGVLLLTAPTTLSRSTAAVLTLRRYQNADSYVLGGKSAVSTSVRGAIQARLR